MPEAGTVGFIDIGTNSVHLLVVKFIPGTRGVDIAQEREVIRLGRSLYSKGTIDDAAISKCRLVIDRFVSYAKFHGAEKVIAYATCASREADNGEALIAALSNPDIELNIIPGEEEARLIRLGILGEASEKENTLLIDIGGGSTEMSLYGKDGRSFYVSLPLGAVRFAYGHPYDPALPLPPEGYERYVSEIEAIAGDAVRRIREIGFTSAIGSSGTFETLADMSSASKSTVELGNVSEWVSKACGMDIDERRRIPKLNPDRADIIIAGGVIAETLLRMLGDPEVSISRKGLKEGMMEDYRIRSGIPDVPIRDSSVCTLLYRSSADVLHARKVREYAEKIFDRLRTLGLHSMDGHARELLGYASELHDIGEMFSYSRHHILSSSLITDVGLAGFGNDELRSMSVMVRYHHKRMPSAADIRETGALDVDSILKCIVILRLADALDRHRSQTVRDIRLSREDGSVRLEIMSEDDVSMELWRVNDCSKDFSTIFGENLTASSTCPQGI